MKVIVDRIEENYLIIELENGKTYEIPKEIIPEVIEGDVINLEIDRKETKNRQKKIKNIMNQVFKD